MRNRWRSYCMNNMASRITKFGRNLIYIYHINVWSRIYSGGKDKIFILNPDFERDNISLVCNCIYSESIKIRKFRASYVSEFWPLISRLLLLCFFFLNLEAWIWAFWILFSFRAFLLWFRVPWSSFSIVFVLLLGHVVLPLFFVCL